MNTSYTAVSLPNWKQQWAGNLFMLEMSQKEKQGQQFFFFRKRKTFAFHFIGKKGLVQSS
jgi:hypothetical protein